MTGIEDLIARLEAAEAGSRELDAEIAATIKGVIDTAQWRDPRWFEGGSHYTTSLDAALTLVPENYCWRYDSALTYAEVFDIGTSPITVFGSADSPEIETYPPPALSLCIAALKARTTQ